MTIAQLSNTGVQTPYLVLNNGNVGINQASPAYTLDVNGYMRTNNRNVAFKYVYTGSGTFGTNPTVITWSTADSTLPYSTVGSGGNFVAPVAGLYHFTYSWGWTPSSSPTNFRIFMTKSNPALGNGSNPDPTASGSSAFAATELCNSSASALIQSCSAPIICAVGDVIQCWFAVSSGTSGVYSWANRASCCYLAGHMISAN